MSQTSFAKGNVVTLKSGGPTMTVDEVDGSEIKCVWFDEKHERQEATFTLETLQIVEQKKLIYPVPRVGLMVGWEGEGLEVVSNRKNFFLKSS